MEREARELAGRKEREAEDARKAALREEEEARARLRDEKLREARTLAANKASRGPAWQGQGTPPLGKPGSSVSPKGSGSGTGKGAQGAVPVGGERWGTEPSGGSLNGLRGARGRRLLEASAQLASVEGRSSAGSEAVRKERGESLDLFEDLEHAYRGAGSPRSPRSPSHPTGPPAADDLQAQLGREDPLGLPPAAVDDVGLRPGSDPTVCGGGGGGEEGEGDWKARMAATALLAGGGVGAIGGSLDAGRGGAAAEAARVSRRGQGHSPPPPTRNTSVGSGLAAPFRGGGASGPLPPGEPRRSFDLGGSIDE